jgi:hypothetical protein
MQIADPELAALLTPLTTEEKAHLEHSLKTEGCRDPIVVWKGHDVLLDGYARLEICTTRLNIPFTINQIDLPNREAAILWRLQQQIGRRNTHPVAASYYRGLLYLRLRKKPGRPKGSKPGQSARKSTDETLGKQFGVDPRTARRDARFAAALDSLAADLGDELRTLVLTRKSNLTRGDVVRLAAMAREEQKRFLLRKEEQNNQPKTPRRTPAAVSSCPDMSANEHKLPATTDAVDSPCNQKEPADPPAPAGTDAATDSHNSDTPPSSEPEHHTSQLVPSPEAEPRVEPVDVGLLWRLEELWRRAGHATRLAFLSRPAVQAAIRRLDASRST